VVAVANAVEHADETLQSLQFGSRAMHVQTKAVVNESLGSKLLNADLLAKLANLEIMSPCLVDASLLAKEEELERIQEALLASPPPFNANGQALCFNYHITHCGRAHDCQAKGRGFKSRHRRFFNLHPTCSCGLCEYLGRNPREGVKRGSNPRKAGVKRFPLSPY